VIIGKYIRQLLTDKKVVVFPGFGSLQLQESGNPFPAKGGTLSPPGSSIMFDSGNSKDDGVLAEAYASGENIDEEESRQQVLELVDAIKFAFDKGESYLLAETGTLSRDEDGKVIFQIVPDWILEPDQYGLETMELLELDELEQQTIIKDETGIE